MPKEKASKSKTLRGYVTEFGDGVLSTDCVVLNCVACKKSINTDTRFQVLQHLKTAKHLSSVDRKKTRGQHLFITGCLENQGKLSTFSLDLCIALTAPDIPLHKLENPQFQSFLNKYLSNGEAIPHDSTLRKRYMSIAYEPTMKNMQQMIKGKKIWISIDETIDKVGRQIANVVIGTLLIEEPGKQYLLTTEVLEKTNHSTIARLFTDSLKLLGPDFNPDDILLFLTDGVAYMKKAGKTLRNLYPRMIHVTCLAHGLHRVAEAVRALYPDVDELISNGK